MRAFRKMLYGLLLSAILFAGCTEQQMQEIDKAAVATKEITGAGEQFMESPAGQYVSPDLKFGIALGGFVISSLVNAWQEWRLKNMTKTTKAIVKGIETAEKESSGNPPKAKSIKANIEAEMKATKIYDRGNKIVDKLKIA